MAPSPSTASEPPIPVLLNAPGDLDELLKRLNRPDFLVVPGSEVKGPDSPSAPAPSAPPVISSWLMRGEVFGDLAHLTIELECRLDGPGPVWMPVKLDGLTVNEVREGSQSLPSRSEAGGTAIELRGKGLHRVLVETRVPVLSTADGRTLSMAIPPVASTSIQLRVPGVVESCSAGSGEPVACLPVEAGHLTELTTRLSPRSRLQLQWRVKTDAGANLPPLLSTRGEIALEVDQGTIKARSSWNLSAIRGQVDRLSLAIGPQEELVDVELDGRPVAVVSGSPNASGPLVIPLIDPLRAGQVRTLTLTTRRSIDAKSSRDVTYNGIRFEHAVDQSGAIAVSQDPSLWIQPVGLRGLRRIDPRTELPQDLRSRPSISMAFAYNDLPFDLRLSIEPSPARLRVSASTTVAVEPAGAKVYTVLDCESSKGRPFEVRILVPEGLEFQQAGPVGVVEGTQVRRRVSKAEGPAGSELSIRLNRETQDPGRFRIVLQGAAKLDGSGAARIPIFTPLAETPVGGQLAVVTPPGSFVEVATGSNAGAFRRMINPPRTWEWPPSFKADPGSGISWFRHDSGASELPISLTVLPVQVRHESITTTNLESPELEWVSDIRLQVDHGSIRTLDLEIPAALEEWTIAGANVARRERLKDGAGGRGIDRVWFSRELAGSVTLRVKGHGAFDSAADPGWDALPDVRVLDGEERNRRVRFLAGQRRQVEARISGWRELSEGTAGDLAPSVSPANPAGMTQRTFEALAGTTSPLLFRIRPTEAAELPRLVIGRCWLRSTATPDRRWITSAWFQGEGPAGFVDLAIPEGSTLVRVRSGLDGSDETPESLDRPNHFRVSLQREAAGAPFLLSVIYETPAQTDPTIAPPQILGESAILHAIWDVWIGDNRTGVSVPGGWNDDNRWSWQGTHFLRTPMRTPTEVARWVTPPGQTARIPELLDQGLAEGQHGYQFSRAGGLGPLRFRTVTRAVAVSVCSGIALAIGLIFITIRLPARFALGLGLLAAFVLGCVLEPSLSLLIVQSSFFGIVLSLGSAGIHWFIDRKSPPAYASGELTTASALERMQATGSTRSANPEAPPASDLEGSTAIRPRLLPSTADRLVLSPTLPPPADEPPSARPFRGDA